VVVAVAAMCHVFSMQIGQAEKTKQISTGSQMMHENGRRQNEEKNYVSLISIALS